MVGTLQSKQVDQVRRVEWSGKVALIAKPGGPNTGVGRYVHMLHKGLREAGVGAVRIAPSFPPLPNTGYSLLRRSGIDLRAFLMNYPIWANYPAADIYHVTSQNLASLLLFRRPKGKVIVTVHDIIPYLLRNDPELCSYHTFADRLFDRMAMAGLKRADRLVADSRHTKQCIVEHLGIAQEKIDVIYLGIDHERFRSLPVPLSLYEWYGLPEDRRYLIYVGSEDPRKNLDTLLHAFARVHCEMPDVELIKVGPAHFARERRRLIDLAVEAGICSAIHFLDDVPEHDLPLLYNLADVCVMPSLYEGFGFPVLEAMACGTTVIAASVASLPELISNAGLNFQPGPHASDALAATLLRVLSDDALRRDLATKGRLRSTAFGWAVTVQQMLHLYRDMSSSMLPDSRPLEN